MEQRCPLHLDLSEHGEIRSVSLYGRSLLHDRPCESELWVNGAPLKLRPHVDPNDPTRAIKHLKGERFLNHFSGWSLVLSRKVGTRSMMAHPCVGIQTLIRRELCDQTVPCPGPGGPVVEAPLQVDTLSILNWNWKFWGDDTRMIFSSLHGTGPTDEWGHAGHEHDTPERAKQFLQNVWRRIYPGCMLIHGGLLYDAQSHNWLAITCRQPQVGYIVNIENAGRGVSYDFTLHAPFPLGESLTLPEIKLYYGPDHDSMMRWLADYAGFYYETPPAWVNQKVWSRGIAWDAQPTWREQADHWEKQLDSGEFNAVSYSLVTNRPVKSGTTPLGYEPDPNHGSISEFKSMCHRLADRGVPLLVWMSHSGLCYRGGPEIDDDWFIRGIDGRICASWGTIDQPELAHINPGHPGYIEYTKKWIRFYISECRCKGIFFDCLSWAFPPDFRPRSFMRYPGDTNRMAIRFINEIYAEIKRCDPEAILLGEGATLEAPVNVVAIASNPVREGSVDSLGPRDFLLQLNAYSKKRFVVDGGPALFVAGGFCDAAADQSEANRFLTQFLAEQGENHHATPLPGDLSILRAGEQSLLVVPFHKRAAQNAESRSIALPPAWDWARTLVHVLTGERHARRASEFLNIKPGIYRMQNS